MKFKDKFRFVRQNMKKNKSRVFMTVLATAMGCAFLVVLASVGFGLQKSVIGEITEGRLLTDISVYGKQQDNEYHNLNDKDIAYLESLDHVKAVTRRQMVDQPALFKHDQYEANQQALVVHLPSEIKAGFELSEGRMPKADNEVIVGYHFQQSLLDPTVKQEEPSGKGNVNPPQNSYKGQLIGKTIHMEVRQYFNNKEEIKSIPLKIVGITKKPTREWMMDTNVIISEAMLKQIEQFTKTKNGFILDPNTPEDVIKERMKDTGSTTYSEVHVYADNVEAVEGIAKQMDKRGYSSHSIINELKEVNMVFLIVKIGLIIVGTIAILIASIGIYNTMTMAVTERTPDIGIMKAIGAHPSTIKNIFLIESSYIGLLGALIGTVVSYGVSYAVNFILPIVIENFFDEKPPANLQFSYIPLSLTLICVGISLGVAVLSGMRPAKRATQVDVLKAMRRDI